MAITLASAQEKITNVPIMILVHPDSLCGSAEFNLGTENGRNARRIVQSDVETWHGSLLVLQGRFSDELKCIPYIRFGDAIKLAVARAKDTGFGRRLRAMPGPHMQIGLDYLQEKKISLDAEIRITGAWADKDSGCVTGMHEILVQYGYTNVQVLPSALSCDEPAPSDGEAADVLRENTPR